MRALGYLLQVVGLILLPVGLAAGFSWGGMGVELALLAAGGGLFLLGRRIAGT